MTDHHLNERIIMHGGDAMGEDQMKGKRGGRVQLMRVEAPEMGGGVSVGERQTLV